MAGEIARLVSLLARPERRFAVWVLALTVLSIGFQLVGVGAILPFLQIVTNPQMIQDVAWLRWTYDALGFQSVEAFLIFAGIAVIVAIVVSNIMLALTEYAQLRLEWRIHYRLSMRLLDHYIGQDYAYFLENNASRLSKNLLYEVHQITSGIVHPGLVLLSKGVLVAVLLTFLVLVDPMLALVMAAFTASGYLAAHGLILGRVQHLGAEYVKANQERYKVVNEAFGGAKEIKVMGREQHVLDLYDRPSQALVRSHTRHQVLQMMPKYIIEAFAFGGLMVAFIGFLLAGRDVAAMVPVMGLFAFAGYRLMPAFRDILMAVTSMRFHDSILSELHDDLQSDADRTEPNRRQKHMSFEKEICLEGITFEYPTDPRPVLQGVDLVIHKNETVGFVGSTGAGKSTLVDLVMGLHRPSEGRVLVDGQPLDPNNAQAWRDNIGYVPQEIFLLDDTIRKNIAFGLGDDVVDDEAVQRAARVAHIHEFILTLPKKYDTVVGERGVRLSGGQRQRIGIARALYDDPSVLVLDEATSDIDNVVEAAITQAISTLAGRKTLIIVAHRLITIQGCDRIFLLDEGRILAQAPYDELLEREPKFRSLVEGGRQMNIATT